MFKKERNVDKKIDKKAEEFEFVGWDPVVSPPPAHGYELNCHLEEKQENKIREYISKKTNGEFPREVHYTDGLSFKYDIFKKGDREYIIWSPDSDPGDLGDKIETILEYEGYEVKKMKKDYDK